jgi:hypothetical protein
LLTFLGVVALVGALVPAAAAQQDFSSANLDTPGTSRVVELPPAAGNHAVSLGTAFDPGSGQMVEGYAIFHHRPGHGGGPGGGGSPGGDGSGDTSSCFALLSKGAAWDDAEPWVFNTSNIEALNGNSLFNNLRDDLAKWETAANANIFGQGSTTGAILSADTVSPDGVNEVYFGDVNSSNAIAVTILWGVFNGPPPFRTLVEWDIVFDQVDFDWSLTGAPGEMDFENIATHETGHAAGLGHPGGSCTEESMYAVASLGETKKRDLNDGDIAGINQLY